MGNVMCKLTMRNIFLLLAILISLPLSSCTLPLEMSLFNNTSYKILVVMREEEILIDPGQSKQKALAKKHWGQACIIVLLNYLHQTSCMVRGNTIIQA